MGGPGAVGGAREARWFGGFEAGECGDREGNSVGGGIGAMARDFAGQEGLRKGEGGSGSHGFGIDEGLKKWTVRIISYISCGNGASSLWTAQKWR